VYAVTEFYSRRQHVLNRFNPQLTYILSTDCSLNSNSLLQVPHNHPPKRRVTSKSLNTEGILRRHPDHSSITKLHILPAVVYTARPPVQHVQDVESARHMPGAAVHAGRIPGFDPARVIGDDDLRGERGAVACGVVRVADDLAAADVEGVAVGALVHVVVVLFDGLHLRGDVARGQGRVHTQPAAALYNGDIVDILNRQSEGTRGFLARDSHIIHIVDNLIVPAFPPATGIHLGDATIILLMPSAKASNACSRI